MEPIILGIESSCDDTSAAILQGTKVLANVTANQQIHEDYGGVVPELASRAHQANIVPVVEAALRKAGVDRNQLNAIGCTSGPGLMGSLLVGTSFARSMALALRIPYIPVNHMQAHILAHFIHRDEKSAPEFPFLCLTVSGGHTQIVLVHDPHRFELIGQTQDDAAGEAFDKAAKIMGLPYPGGPLIDKYAQQGDPSTFRFTKPSVPGLNFSFSGLKTNFLYFLQSETARNANFVEEHLHDLCASLQATIVDMLMDKLKEAVELHGIKRIAIAGGVSANSSLRSALEQQGNWEVYIPPMEYCTDNGAMIGIAAYFALQDQRISALPGLAQARMKVTE